MKKIISNKGFTLVEILVVISIIGVLSAVIYASFGEARQDAKNKALRSEMKEVQLALELYRSQNGEYPSAFDNGTSGCNTSGATSTAKNSVCGTNNPLIAGLIPEFISDIPLPSDSANPGCDLIYKVDANNHSWYKLTAENCFAGATNRTEGVQPNDTMARCPSTCSTCSGDTVNAAYLALTPFYESFSIYSIGGQCE